MNLYAWIVLAALLAGFVLDLLSGIFTLQFLSGALPEELKDCVDAATYARSQEYTRARTRFGFLVSGVGLALIGVFWFSGGFNALDVCVRRWGLHPILAGLAYLGILALLKGALSLPFSLWSTFVIEERFGFNRTTLRTYIFDLAKGLALAVLLGGPLLACILALFEYAGPLAWLICWAVAALFTLFVQYIAPAWIMPLFNTFEPLKDGELKESILQYAGRVRYPVREVSVMDGSRRSGKSNAFFTGFGKHRRIALFDTLIEKHTVPELVAILAHEIGHYKKKHLLIGIGLGVAHAGILFFLLSVFMTRQGLFDAFFMEHSSFYAGMLFFALLYAPVEMVLAPLQNLLSRRFEKQADRYAVETSGYGDDLISGLKKLSAHNLSNLRPHPFTVFMHYSHPPLLARIRAIRECSISTSVDRRNEGI